MKSARVSLIVIFFTVESPTANVFVCRAVAPAAGANEYLGDGAERWRGGLVSSVWKVRAVWRVERWKGGIKCAALLENSIWPLELFPFFFQRKCWQQSGGKHPVPTVLHCRPCWNLRRPVHGFKAAAGESLSLESKAPETHHVVYFRALTERTEGLRDKELITGVNHAPPDCIPVHIVMLRLLNSRLATVTIPLCVAMVMKRFSS